MSPVHVAVAAIVNENNEVLIARRPDHVHQGGLWEFPGGKLEAGESTEQALRREIDEELGIHIDQAQPLIQIIHHYHDKSVLLDVCRVSGFTGTPRGREGQPVRWQHIDDLCPEEFPAANAPIIRALQLPAHYVITGEFTDHDDLNSRLQRILQAGARLIQLRVKNEVMGKSMAELAAGAYALCDRYGARLLINTGVDEFIPETAHGLHLSSGRLMNCNARPVDAKLLLSVSCHNEDELHQAQKLGADIILLSPVKETSSHPGVPGIGWRRFAALVSKVNSPVYALGGMSPADVDDARRAGGQGIAAISAFWKHEQ